MIPVAGLNLIFHLNINLIPLHYYNKLNNLPTRFFNFNSGSGATNSASGISEAIMLSVAGGGALGSRLEPSSAI